MTEPYRPFEQSVAYYDAIYGYKDYAAEAGRLHELIQQRRPGARTLLDVACGSGRHIEHLAAFYDVTGVDTIPAC
jgi:SAM-dependent methyltransferase